MSDTENITADDDVLEATEGDLDVRAAARDAEKAEADKASDAELVAQRSADISETEADEHVKVFVLPPGPKPTEANGFDHGANMAATRQYMMSQGLRPTGDVRHVSTKPYGPGGKSWALTYAVPAVPAERFDFAEVHVITENEDPDGDGHVSGTQDGGASSSTSGDDDAPKPPTEKDNRATIDAYAAGLTPALDTTGAASKAEALELIAAHKPTA